MVIKVIQVILSPVLALVVGIFFWGLAGKIIARIHCRYGPSLIQPLIDIIRLFYQKSVSHGRMFDLGIIFSLAGSDVCGLCYHEYSEIAMLTGPLADGVSGSQLLRDSLNRILAGKKTYAMPGYAQRNTNSPPHPRSELSDPTNPCHSIKAHSPFD